MKNKPSLYLLPGLLCDETVWLEQIKALEPYADIRIPSFKGHDSLQTMAQQVLDEAPEKFSVVGHSMGGRVALELIHMAEFRLEKFALMDTGVHPVKSGEEEKRRPMIELAQQQGIAALARQWAPPMVGRNGQQDKVLMESIYTMVERYSPQEYLGQIEALMGRADQTPYLASIQLHVLLICGEEDVWSPVSQHEEMLTQLSSAELKVIKDSGHMVTMEQPEDVSSVLLDWFLS